LKQHYWYAVSRCAVHKKREIGFSQCFVPDKVLIDPGQPGLFLFELLLKARDEAEDLLNLCRDLEHRAPGTSLDHRTKPKVTDAIIGSVVDAVGRQHEAAVDNDP